MEARAKLFGHAIHQMLIAFPLGLLPAAVIFDVIYLFGGATSWVTASWYMIAAGVIGGLAAALFGFIDWLAIPGGTRAKRVGALHGVGNVVVAVLFAASWFLRLGGYEHPSTLAFICSFVGVAVAGVAGWLGGELVDRLGVGIDDGAHVDAPSSLSGRPARDAAAPMGGGVSGAYARGK